MGAGRIAAVVVGSIGCVVGLVLLLGGGIALGIGALFDADAQRSIRSDASAVVVGDVVGKRFGLGNTSYEGDFALRFTATPSDPSSSVFLGVGRTADVAAYLRGVDVALEPAVSSGSIAITPVGPDGGRAPAPPIRQEIWNASVAGRGAQTLDWGLRNGAWTVVLMRPGGESGIAADVRTQVRVPFFDWVSRRLTAGVLLVGALLIVVGAVLVLVGLRRRRPPPGPTLAPPDTPVNPVGRF